MNDDWIFQLTFLALESTLPLSVFVISWRFVHWWDILEATPGMSLFKRCSKTCKDFWEKMKRTCLTIGQNFKEWVWYEDMENHNKQIKTVSIELLFNIIIHTYYPTALHRVQIMPKTSTNITWYWEMIYEDWLDRFFCNL